MALKSKKKKDARWHSELTNYGFVRKKKPNIFLHLKGQCHEMVVEVRPWSGRLGLN
jgi:hypothetical protein